MGPLTTGRSRGDEMLLAHLLREANGRCPSCDRRLDFGSAVVVQRTSYDLTKPWLRATSSVRCHHCRHF